MPGHFQRLYRARFASDASDLLRLQRMRHRAFWGSEGQDADDFDARCTHILIEDKDGQLCAGFRLLPFDFGYQIHTSYSAQYYDLERLSEYSGKLIEVGRFCVEPGHNTPDLLRVLWASATKFVDEHKIGLMFGCTSFAGTDPTCYHRALPWLAAHHLAPDQFRPHKKSAQTIVLSRDAALPNRKDAMQEMPALLRSYLRMGGWVSDHAVIDHHMNTIHVFTGLEIGAVPFSRAAALRSLVG